MKVIVLGAGLLGVTSAYFLRQQGHDVSVVDRQASPAAETSFANGGQISVSHAEPWANPSAPLKVLKWLGQEDAPLLFRIRADMRQWLWGLQFLRECSPVAHPAQHRADRPPGDLQPRHAAAASSRDRHRLRRAHTGHPALLHQREGVRRRRRPRRADAGARLRPARHLRRRGGEAGARPAPHPPATRRSHLHRRGRVGRCQPLCPRTGPALRGRWRAVPP